MKALNAYIEQKNKRNAIFKGEQFELKTAQARQRVADILDCDLSPENLTCDGELSRAQVNAKYKALRQAAIQLTALDPQVKMYEFA